MPSTHSTSVFRLLPSSTVITPSLPTFSMASANRSPISVSLLLATVPTWAISFLLLIEIDIFCSFSVMSATAFSMPCFICSGIDAGHDGLETFVEDRLGQHRGRGRAVAGDVAGLRGDFADHAGAHVLVDVFQVDLLGHGDAVLGHGRRAEALLQNYVAALGAERHLDRPGQLGNAAANRLAGFLIKCNGLCHLLNSPERFL